jgi:hypothetical protein
MKPVFETVAAVLALDRFVQAPKAKEEIIYLLAGLQERFRGSSDKGKKNGGERGTRPGLIGSMLKQTRRSMAKH